MRKVFDQPGDFAAMRAAEAWLGEHGYSVGTCQRGSPRAIRRGEWFLPKWRHLDSHDRANLDGTLTGDMRNGPVVVEIKEARK